MRIERGSEGYYGMVKELKVWVECEARLWSMAARSVLGYHIIGKGKEGKCGNW